MKSLSLPPSAPVLLESLRAIGYDAPAAVADLVDNSITAGARHVTVRFDPGEPRAVAVMDDGAGMTRDELASAMRHGSRSPVDARSANDLGRFGLGLKTASMSQCRRLTVVARRGGKTHGMMWDLDDVARSNDWLAGVLEPADIDRVPFIEEWRERDSGTLVAWEKLDRLADGDRGDGSVLGERMRAVGDHLALVFHRYLSGRTAPLVIDVNRLPIQPLDPFLEDDGSDFGQEERIRVEGHHVVLQAYTLPHISRLTRSQVEKAGGEVGLRRRQGFYVYRNQRLIVWGTWFGMTRQEELSKLTRVRVDVPNALDHLWSLDIKKSRATPPAVIRERLKGLVPRLVDPGKQAHQYRGRVTRSKGSRPIWRRIEDRDGVRYEIDFDHPLVAALRAGAENGMLGELDNVLRAVARTLPIEALYIDRANDQIGFKPDTEISESVAEELDEMARQMIGAFPDGSEEQMRLIAGLGRIEPFSLHPDLVRKIQSRLSSR